MTPFALYMLAIPGVVVVLPLFLVVVSPLVESWIVSLACWWATRAVSKSYDPEAVYDQLCRCYRRVSNNGRLIFCDRSENTILTGMPDLSWSATLGSGSRPDFIQALYYYAERLMRLLYTLRFWSADDDEIILRDDIRKIAQRFLARFLEMQPTYVLR